MGQADFAWLNGLRREHFPPERNRVPAHLTLFHAVAPSAEDEARRRLAKAARSRAPDARIDGVMNLGRGAALRVFSDGLAIVRGDLADAFHGLLTAQDMAPWRPHITIQNKADPDAARALVEHLRTTIDPRPLKIAGLQLIRYADGDWEPLGRWAFSG
ncbi:2'-5' RNA ligase family protein [Sphingomonas sabuli]|uniref:2'-5' RNA ligase family protein n=2 Tax=Sphingomonas sabuli TaxID=2764186 RepID=A0A7G9L5R4_9SPHN|nr:2'-5' RNA ligase family protein [Sphingomonas sabuli]